MIWCHLPTAKDDLRTFSCCFVTLITTLAFTPQRIFKVQKNTRALFWVELRCTTIYGITFLFLRLESVPKILILKLCGLLSECVWTESAAPLPELTWPCQRRFLPRSSPERWRWTGCERRPARAAAHSGQANSSGTPRLLLGLRGCGFLSIPHFKPACDAQLFILQQAVAKMC